MKTKFFIIFLLITSNIYSQEYEKYYISNNTDINILSVAFSLNSKYVYATTSDGRIVSIDFLNKEVILTKRHEQKINRIVVSEKYIFTTSTDGCIKIWNNSFELLKSFSTNDTLNPIIYNKDTDCLYTAGQKGIVYKIDLENKKMEEIYSSIIEKETRKIKYKITNLFLLPNNKLAICSGNIRIIDLNTNNEITSFPKDYKDLSSFAFYESQLVGWSFFEKKLLYWNDFHNYPDNYETVLTNSYPFSSKLIFIDENLVLTGVRDSAVIINIETKQIYFSLPKEHVSSVITLDITKDKKYIATGGLGGSICVWTKKENKAIKDTLLLPTSILEFNTEIPLKIMFNRQDSSFANPILSNIEIENIVQIIRDNKDKIKLIEINGYATEVKNTSNMQIDSTKKVDLKGLQVSMSKSRANVVKKNILEKSDIEPSLIETTGYGATNFINDDPYNPNNLRVEIKIITKEKNNSTENEYSKDSNSFLKRKTVLEYSVKNENKIIESISLSDDLNLNLLVGNKIVPNIKINYPDCKLEILEVNTNNNCYYFRIPVWTIETIKDKPSYYYSNIENDKVAINRNVNCRLKPYGSLKIGNTLLKKGATFQYIKTEDVGGYDWYNFYIYGYFIKK